MDRAVVTIPVFHEITQIVRILPPPPSWIGARLGHAKPQCFGDSRDSKNVSIWAARSEMQRRTTPCTELHGRYRRPKQLARNAENPEKTRVLERRGQDSNFPRFFCDFYSRTGNPPSRRFCRPTASNGPLRILLGIVAKNGTGVDRVPKMLAEPLVL